MTKSKTFSSVWDAIADTLSRPPISRRGPN